jgi:transposase
LPYIAEDPDGIFIDTIERRWRHLNFFQLKTYLHRRVPRKECAKCGVKQVKVPQARERGANCLADGLLYLDDGPTYAG